MTTEQAATIGVGLLTAALGVNVGTKVEPKAKEVETNAPWMIILGAAGSVGQFAVQLAKLCGYRVLASCSPSNNELVKSLGVDAAFSYKLSLKEQLSEIESITGGKFSRIFDASAMGTETGMEALAHAGNKDAAVKYFSTTNDWSAIEPKEGVEIYKVTLGIIGREGDAHTDTVNKDIADLIRKLEPYLENGQLKPIDYVKVGNIGVGEVLEGIKAFGNHKSGKKLVVRLATE